MKKSILSFVLLLLAIGGVKAQEVTVADVEALPGEVVSFSVNLSNGKANTYTSLQFDLGLPTGITTTGSPTFSASWPGATGVVAEKGAFASAEVMTGSDIEGLVSVSLKVDESMDYGSYDVTLSNIQFRYGTEGAHDDAQDVTFKVNVVNMHTIILDENSTVVPVSSSGVIAKVRRTIKANQWSTICLPFAMTVAQTKEAFGEDVQLADFNGYETIEDNNENIVGINVKFNNATEIEANHPYMIKVSSPISVFTVDGVDIAPEEEPTVAAVKRTKKQWSEMIGTYTATTVDNQMLFLNNNQFWYSTGSSAIKGYRAYFDFYDVLTAVENAYSSRIGMVFMDEETGIKCLTPISLSVKGEGSIYSLDGRKVTSMRKGVYVKNNKKVVVK